MIDERIKHIAIIMDGNGRWATKRGLARSMGHKEGADTLEKIALYANEIGLKYLSVYAFSTDNFKRDQQEVDFLMDLFVKMFKTKFATILKKEIKVVFSGSKDVLRDDVKEAMDSIVSQSKDNKNGVLNICLNYGGQEEIIRASERYHEALVENKVRKEDINRENFSQFLDHDIPPIDILIRTGGEKRISNFMLYQMSYAEMYFSDTLFPDFDSKELDSIIDNFLGRERRFGGNHEKK